MAPLATAMAANGAAARISVSTHARPPLRTQRSGPCDVLARRRHLVVRAAEADRSREQDTVGDMSKDQVSSALERQLQRSKGGFGTDNAAGSGDSNGEVAAVEEALEVVKEEPATDAEREESVRALEQLKGRVPLMSQANIQSAIDRLIQRGGGGQASKSSGSKDSSSSSSRSNNDNGSSQGSDSKAASSSGSSGKQGKYDADRTYEDGSLLFTAESLAAVSFDELKP